MMSSQKQIVLAFDVYGTLLSTESIAQQLASHLGQDKANGVAAEWRKYQLEYTWRLNSMDQYEPFSSVTRKSLQHALAEAGERLPDTAVEELMRAYDTLSVFPDVPPLFEHLDANERVTAVLFSNGTHSMISTSLARSPDLSPHKHLFADVVVVEPVKKFKPHRAVYEHLCQSVGKEGRASDVWLVSGNPFDVVGANAAGMRTCWVDRSGKGWADRLGNGEKGGPTVVVRGIEEVVKKVEGFSGL